MNTIQIIILYIITIIIFYYINRRLLIDNLSRGNSYNWDMVCTNIGYSMFIFPSVFYWIIVILYRLPKFPKRPPKWL
jgi:hypothetical protein